MKSLFSVHRYGDASNEKVIFFFSAYGIPAWQFALPGFPIWRLRRAGWHVVAYDYPLSIANRHSHHTLVGLEAVVTDARQSMHQLTNHGPRRWAAMGVSLGTVPAITLVSREPIIDNLVINLPYSDIAKNIQHLPPLWLIPPPLKRRYIARSGGLEAIRSKFETIDPLRLVPYLAQTNILMYVSRRDRLLKYTDSELLRQRLAGRPGGKLEYHENRHFGHYWSAAINNLEASTYLKFIQPH